MEEFMKFQIIFNFGVIALFIIMGLWMGSQERITKIIRDYIKGLSEFLKKKEKE